MERRFLDGRGLYCIWISWKGTSLPGNSSPAADHSVSFEEAAQRLDEWRPCRSYRTTPMENPLKPHDDQYARGNFFKLDNSDGDDDDNDVKSKRELFLSLDECWLLQFRQWRILQEDGTTVEVRV